MRYFERFNLIPYTITLEDGTQTVFYVKDIFERVKMLDSVITNINAYYQYSMQEGDTFENIAYRYYGDVNKFWIVAFTNKIIDPFYDVPLRYQQFIDYIDGKYGSISNSQNILDHYEKKITTVLSSANGYYSTSNTVTYYANNTYSIDGSQTLPTILNPVITLPSPPSVIIDNGITLSQTIQLSAVSAYDQEYNTNEKRRNIFIIKKTYASSIEKELVQLLSR